MHATARSSEIHKFRLKAGDVLITKDSETADDIAVPSFVSSSSRDLVCGYHLCIIRPRPDSVIGSYLAQVLGFGRVHHQFVAKANGVTRYGLTLPTISGIRLCLPCLAEQTAISDALWACEDEAQALLVKLAALQAQKKGLMQRLLTGKVRASA